MAGTNHRFFFLLLRRFTILAALPVDEDLAEEGVTLHAHHSAVQAVTLRVKVSSQLAGLPGKFNLGAAALRFQAVLQSWPGDSEAYDAGQGQEEAETSHRQMSGSRRLEVSLRRLLHKCQEVCPH